jgi:hypothetical protein
VDIAAEQFDTFFLSGDGSEWHKKFLKCVQQFAEKWGVGTQRAALTTEQEVH